MQDLKSVFGACLDEKYLIHPLHKLATGVCPSFKHLTFVDSEEREEVYTQMRSKMDSLTSFTSEDSDSSHEPSTKKIKLDGR